ERGRTGAAAAPKRGSFVSAHFLRAIRNPSGQDASNLFISTMSVGSCVAVCSPELLNRALTRAEQGPSLGAQKMGAVRPRYRGRGLAQAFGTTLLIRCC